MACLMAAYPLVIRKAVDMFARKDPRILYQIPILVVILTGLKALSQYAQTLLLQRLSLDTIQNLQHRLLKSLLHKDIATIEAFPPSEWTSRFTTEAMAIREALTRATNAVGDITTVLGLGICMMWLDWELAIVALILYPLTVLPVRNVGKKVKASAREMQRQTAKMIARLTENFALVRPVRLHNMEKMQYQTLGGELNQLRDAHFAMARNKAKLDPLLEVIAGASVAIAFGFAGWRSAMGGASLGDFTAFIAALFAASRPMRSLASLNAALQEGAAGLSHIFKVIDAPILVADSDAPVALPRHFSILAFENVSYQYEDGRWGLKDFSLKIKEGSFLAIVGESGAGKSTALSLIPRLHDPSSGRLLLAGRDLKDFALKELRSFVGYVGQETPLFNMSLLDNIRISRPEASKEEVESLCKKMDLNFIQKFPEGLETFAGTRGEFLSGGERQRIAIARALLRQPAILVLDEAMSALDANSEAKMEKFLRHYRKGKTTIMVSHRLTSLSHAHFMAVMQEGRLVQSGKPRDLIREQGLYAEMASKQGLTSDQNFLPEKGNIPNVSKTCFLCQTHFD
ncbi:ABC transporter ATP-binding protein [Acetobacteraceae bacterium]|nr:ABC transporter ATP-binding protein [Acetobacteraceae bacterium]